MSEELLNACYQGDFNQVKTLLTNKDNMIDIHYKSKDGITALMYACHCGYLLIVKYLLTSNELTKHSDIHHKNNNGQNALIYAARNGYIEVVQYLLESDELTEHAEIYHRDKDSWDALRYAYYANYSHVVEYFIIQQNFKVDNNTQEWLNLNKVEEVLSLIESRNLYQKMNDAFSEKDKKSKHRKI